MGADFILAMTPLAVYEDGELVTDFNLISSQVAERISEKIYFLSEIYDVLFFDNDTEEDHIKNIMMAVEQSFLDSIDTTFRDIIHISIPCDKCGADGRVYAASGGMSYGDSSSDAFDYLSRLDQSGLFLEPFKKD